MKNRVTDILARAAGIIYIMLFIPLSYGADPDSSGVYTAVLFAAIALVVKGTQLFYVGEELDDSKNDETIGRRDADGCYKNAG